MQISVIIPTLNEATRIARAIDCAWAADADEVIVSDGGSRDNTTRIADSAGAKVICSTAGRGTQLNAGFETSSGNVLVFLHADSWPAKNLFTQIRRRFQHELASQALLWGGFKQKINNQRPVYRLIEAGNAYRTKFRKLVYGDQAMFVSRQAFQQVGGYKTIPLMEDVCLSDALSILCKPVLLSGPIHVSARRWESIGPLKTTVQNWRFFKRFRGGEPPETLAQEYYEASEAAFHRQTIKDSIVNCEVS